MTDISDLLNCLKPHGLQVLSTLQDSQLDDVDGLDKTVPVRQLPRQLILVGNVGSAMWEIFQKADEYRDSLPHPLDRWSRRVGEEIAGRLGGLAVFPWEGPPYPPFQAWAKKSGESFTSPLSLSIHPEFGLWHAYRFALVFSTPLSGSGIFADVSRLTKLHSPCLDCVHQPCLSTCPVDAFDGVNYRVDECVRFLLQKAGADCRENACVARRACPVGKDFMYQPAHASFHMEAFVNVQKADGE